ncbi:probable ubiquitin-conjugating enzyme E2 26 isoform X1 [Ananas comosus]|uniref:E2 ubiquitin-conjugating enzyme n=1 Tax=Ananas comosus TaxID=4615 RepID=A0A6P5G058_ANACO|nr:probable ubiquitin-conjugating enzyme E2 26 isoform X1 [Ananas comosus]
MEPPPPAAAAAAAAAKYAQHFSKIRLYPGSSSYQDPDIMEVSPSPVWGSNPQKKLRTQVAPHDVIEIDGDDDPDGVVIVGESTPNDKNKQPVGYSNDWQKHVKDALANDLAGPSALKIFDPDSLKTNFSDEYEYDEYNYDEDDDEFYAYDDAYIEHDFNYSLAAKFDDLDLPPGVEATVPWLQKPFSENTSAIKPSGMMELMPSSVAGTIFTVMDVIPNNTTSKPVEVMPSNSKSKPIEVMEVMDDEIDEKYRSFKQFDTVKDHSDHYFTKPDLRKVGLTARKPMKDWSKRIQHEWKVLEKDLPEAIFVRVYEDRMDLLRAVIVGPAGTPYHDGLFFFDIFFPPDYPNIPPKVHYQSGGLRLNPNLYACGKVCLSLLNTWSGKGCEMWNPSNSTMLQVLVSIQALVLNAKPYFNEPGYAQMANTPHGEKKSLEYNEDTFLLSCRTMLYSLRRPPKHFEDFVAGHFRNHGRAILVACRAYMEGAQVGCLVGEGIQDVDEGDKSCSRAFKTNLKKLFEELLMEFTVKGANCREFLAQKVQGGSRAAAAAAATAPTDTTLRLGSWFGPPHIKP